MLGRGPPLQKDKHKKKSARLFIAHTSSQHPRLSPDSKSTMSLFWALLFLALAAASEAIEITCNMRMMPAERKLQEFNFYHAAVFAGVPFEVVDGALSTENIPEEALKEYANLAGIDLRLVGSPQVQYAPHLSSFETDVYLFLESDGSSTRYAFPRVAVVRNPQTGQLYSPCRLQEIEDKIFPTWPTTDVPPAPLPFATVLEVGYTRDAARRNTKNNSSSGSDAKIVVSLSPKDDAEEHALKLAAAISLDCASGKNSVELRVHDERTSEVALKTLGILAALEDTPEGCQAGTLFRVRMISTDDDNDEKRFGALSVKHGRGGAFARAHGFDRRNSLKSHVPESLPRVGRMEARNAAAIIRDLHSKTGVAPGAPAHAPGASSQGTRKQSARQGVDCGACMVNHEYFGDCLECYPDVCGNPEGEGSNDCCVFTESTPDYASIGLATFVVDPQVRVVAADLPRLHVTVPAEQATTGPRVRVALDAVLTNGFTTLALDATVWEVDPPSLSQLPYNASFGSNTLELESGLTVENYTLGHINAPPELAFVNDDPLQGLVRIGGDLGSQVASETHLISIGDASCTFRPVLTDDCSTLDLIPTAGASCTGVGPLLQRLLDVGASRNSSITSCPFYSGQARFLIVDRPLSGVQAGDPVTISVGVSDMAQLVASALSSGSTMQDSLDDGLDVRPDMTMDELSELVDLLYTPQSAEWTLVVVPRHPGQATPELVDAQISLDVDLCLAEAQCQALWTGETAAPDGCVLGCDGQISSPDTVDICGFCGEEGLSCVGCDGVVGSDAIESPCLDCGDTVADAWPPGFLEFGNGIASSSNNYVSLRRRIDPADYAATPPGGDVIYGVNLQFARLDVDPADDGLVLEVRILDESGAVVSQGASSLGRARLHYSSGRQVFVQMDDALPRPSGSHYTVEWVYPSPTSAGTLLEVATSREGEASGLSAEGPLGPIDLDADAHVFPLLGRRVAICNAPPVIVASTDYIILQLCGEEDHENCVLSHEIKAYVVGTERINAEGLCRTTFSYITYWDDAYGVLSIPANSALNYLCGCGAVDCGPGGYTLPQEECDKVPELFVNTYGEPAPPSEWWSVDWPCEAGEAIDDTAVVQWVLRDLFPSHTHKAQSSNRDSEQPWTFDR